MTKTLEQGADSITRLLRLLSDPEGLEGTYAELLLDKARQNAASRPTPQSAMAARALVVSGNLIRSAGDARSDAVAASSEFGSDLYPQFQHSHTGQGLWLYPAASDPAVLIDTDKALDQEVEKAVG